MSTKRKDSKGRVLRQGESQRKDGTYQFRYTDHRGKRKCLYARTLEELRDKEEIALANVKDQIGGGLDEYTVSELVSAHISMKRNLKPTTLKNYNTQLKMIQRYAFADMMVSKVKKSNAIRLFTNMYDDGIAYSSINVVKSLLYSAFKDAVEDDAIRRNPFEFRLAEYLNSERNKVKALTAEEVERLLSFIRGSKCYSRYYDMIVFMLGTGLRASELCGLTISDIDFNDSCVHVKKQLLNINGTMCVCTPKSDSGTRDIPMTPEILEAATNLARARRRCTVERIVDGYSGFIIVSQTGRPKCGSEIACLFKRIETAYNKKSDAPIRLTPHVLRHTFCTTLSNQKVSTKTLQYLMGHSSIDMLQVYDDVQYDVVKEEVLSIGKTS